MIEMLRMLENVTIEELSPCGNGVECLSLSVPSEGWSILTAGSPVMPACGRQGRSQKSRRWRDSLNDRDD
jgi:hypothetical protein